MKRETVRNDMTYVTIEEYAVSDRVHWRQLIHVAYVDISENFMYLR